MHASALDPDVADAIGLRYKKLSMCAKTKFYMDQMKVKFERLQIPVFLPCQYIHEIEVEIKYVEYLDIQWANKACILKAIYA